VRPCTRFGGVVDDPEVEPCVITGVARHRPRLILDRDGGDFTRLGPARFETAVRREITRRGGQRPCLRIVRRLFTALVDLTGVLASPTDAARWTGCSCCWRTGRTPSASSPTPRPGCTRCSTSSSSPRGATSIHGLSTGRGGGDPGRDRRPTPVHQRPGVGQARRPGTAGEALGQLHRPHRAHRPRPTRSSGSRPGARSGEPCRPTPSTPPATPT